MRFVVVGMSYRTSAVELRERLAVNGEELTSALRELSETSAIDEALLISTCNRVDVFATGDDPIAASKAALDNLARIGGVGPSDLEESVYRHVDDDALRHMFRVTASLDSMVVGEAQITGQVKDAFAVAREVSTAGAQLTAVMQRAFSVAKRVRNETGIARHPASVSSVAVELAGRLFEDLGSVAVLVIGAGEMAELALRHLVSDGARRIRVINRSPERAAALAKDFDATSAPFETLEEQLQWADIVISSTAAPEPIITRKMMRSVMRARKQQPVFIVDIAIPRDVEGRVKRMSNVYLFAVDDLERAVAENLAARRKEARVAEKIVEGEVERFNAWLREQQAVPVIKQLRRHFSEVARAEAERAARFFKSDVDQRSLQRMADSIVNKLLHGPTGELKRGAKTGAGAELTRATVRLFDLRVGEADAEAERARDSEADDATSQNDEHGAKGATSGTAGA